MYLLKNKVVFFALFALFALSFLTRNMETAPDIVSLHASNFSITGILFMATVAVPVLVLGFKRNNLLKYALPLLLANVVMELFINVDTIHLLGIDITNFNTPDSIDMVFGLAALAVAIPIINIFSTELSTKESADLSKKASRLFK